MHRHLLGRMNLVIVYLLLRVGRSESTLQGHAGNPVSSSYIIMKRCTRFPGMKSDDLKVKDSITEILIYNLVQIGVRVTYSCYNHVDM
jgi:hypothetical protein